ncbi:MAG: restriction endonuclease subunit S [Candidatus Omnitrophica bacterium]|nr:restriction endonuclease subunit S [Candidatus Omnitrophota bacterium]
MKSVDSLKTQNRFKKTEIGEIPVDWEVVKLRDAISFNYGEGLPEEKRAPGPYPVYGSNGVVGFHEKFLVEGPGIIVGRKGTAGSVVWSFDNFWPIDTTYYILWDKHKVNARYLYYQLQILNLARLNTSTGVPGLNREIALNAFLPLPILTEQTKIAEILLTVDTAIEKIDASIEKNRELKKGLMHQLLTRGIGHTKFKKTEIGEIPADWEVKQIHEICEKPQYGFTASANDKPVGPKLLRITDIQDEGVNWETVPYCECPDSLKTDYLLHVGDILFARTGATTGKSFLIKECPEAVFASYLIRVITKETIIPDYLFLVFDSAIYWKQINQQIGGSAQGGVNASSLAELKVPIPTKPEQKEIARIITSTNQEIESANLQKRILENLKKYLMNVLLTGKQRINF